MKLYYHETDGRAEYLMDTFNEDENGHREGVINDQTKYIVRIDGDITRDAVLTVREKPAHNSRTCENKDANGNACYDCESGQGMPCGFTPLDKPHDPRTCENSVPCQDCKALDNKCHHYKDQRCEHCDPKTI